MTDLRKALTKLASENPDLRKHLVPLLATPSVKTAAVTMADIEKINEMTDENDHGGALLMAAQKLGMKKQAEILKHVNAIHDLDGSLHPALGQYRGFVMEQVFKVAKATKPKDGKGSETVYDLLD